MPLSSSRLKRTAPILAVAAVALLLSAFVAWQHALKMIPAIQYPQPKLPVPNAFDTFIAAGKAYVAPEQPVDVLLDSRRPLAGSHGIDYRRDYPSPPRDEWLQRNGRSLKLARQGLQQRYLHPLFISSASSFKHLDLFTDVANLLAVESHARRLRGDRAGAAESALDVLQFGAVIPRGAPLMAAYCGYRIQALGRHELWQLLPHLDAAATQKTLARLNGIDAHRVDFAETLESEKWLSQATLREIMQSGNWQRSFFQRESRLAFRWRFIKMNYPLILANNRSLFDDSIAAAKTGKEISLIDMIQGSDADPIISRIAPINMVAGQTATLCETGNRLLRTATALQAYRLQNGVYPGELDDLAPRYLKAVPLDPFASNKGLLKYSLEKVAYKVWHYERVDLRAAEGSSTDSPKTEWVWRGKAGAAQTGFKLYSVGANGKDDGGEPGENPKIENEGRYDLSDPTIDNADIVAGVNW